MIISFTKGYLCPSISFNGKVHSVFRRSMNITTDLVEIPLVSLLDKALPETPTGYQCNFKSTGELTAKVKMGDKVFLRGGIIRFQSTSSLEVNTLTATEWLRAPSLLRFNNNRIKKNIFITEELLNQYISIKEETVIYSVNEYIESLDFILPNSIYSSPEKLAKNIGCGKGLHHQVMIFLIGILAVLSSITEMHPKTMILYQSLRTAIQININKTNDISAHYLKLALSCHFSHPVQWLVYYLFTEKDISIIKNSVMTNLNIGSSSGADTVAGMLYCLNNILLN